MSAPAGEATPGRRPTDEDEDHDPRDSFKPLKVEFPSGFGPSGGGLNPSTRRRRHSVSAESDRSSPSSYVRKFIPKPPEVMQRIEAACTKSILFSGLDKQQQQDIYDAMEEIQVKQGDEIIRQGDYGDFFYIIDRGDFRVFKRLENSTQATPQLVFEYNGNGSFGELALMYNSPRAATVKAATEGSLFRVDRETFRAIIIESTARKRRLFEEFLEEVSVLTNLTRQERSMIADCLEVVEFRDGDYIIHQGDEGDKVYFIMEGKAYATQVSPFEKKEITVGKMKQGQYFGERALITREPRAANVIADGAIRCAVMDRSAFERLLGDIKVIMERQLKMYKKAEDITN